MEVNLFYKTIHLTKETELRSVKLKEVTQLQNKTFHKSILRNKFVI